MGLDTALAYRHQGCAQQGHSVPPPLHARCAKLPSSAVTEGQPPRPPQDRQPCQQQACRPPAQIVSLHASCLRNL